MVRVGQISKVPHLVIRGAIFSAGYACTYWAIDVDFFLIVVTMGVSHGIAMGFVYCQVLGAVMKVRNEYSMSNCIRDDAKMSTKLSTPLTGDAERILIGSKG